MAPTPLAMDPGSLARFVDPLRIPALARPAGSAEAPHGLTVPLYRVTMKASILKVHRDLPATPFFTYDGAFPGPTLEVSKGQGILVDWVNALPTTHILPIDHNLHGAEPGVPEVRAVVHVHGAKVPPESDGYPDDWYPPGKSARFYYPNDQDAAMLFYHDHAMGINRLNILAGLVGAYFVRDPAEDHLKLPKGAQEIPLIICDRMFKPTGELYYPVGPKADAPWIPEFFGNGILLNGVLFPYLAVRGQRYRFRVLNSSNGRFLHLSLSNGAALQQVGTDQGLLPAALPVTLVTLAPGERTDLVYDFAADRGKTFTLDNDSVPIMQFRVASEHVEDPSALPPTLGVVPKTPESSAVLTRNLTLNEYDDPVGNPITVLLNASRWNMPVTEKPVLDTVEIWSFINMTDDSHPIHLHLVRFQILDRRRFEPFTYQTSKVLRFTGPSVPPEPSESGWKDTVRADPGMVTRIIVRFEGFLGRYVWHCHILEHEDNEMMRPFEVVKGL